MNHLLLPHTHLCCVGDIHGEFEGLPAWFLKYDMQDTCIVFCGDIGLGFESEAYYEQLFPKLNRECKKRHLSLIFVRGNHDDPSYFICQKINLSNIKAVPDYTILSVAGHHVLCIGGGISIDRMYRQSKMMSLAIKYARFHGCSIKEGEERAQHLYWSEEPPLYNEHYIADIKDAEIMIDVVCSHAAPSFCEPTQKVGIENWLALDPDLEKDITCERATMDHIYDRLVADGHPIKVWCYGHYHFHNVMEHNGIDFRLLDMSYHNSNYDSFELN